MSKKTIEELEFERNRMAILKNNGALDSAKATISQHKQPWEYEIEEYRKNKKMNRFYLFGAICGVLSLVLNVIFNYQTILSYFVK